MLTEDEEVPFINRHALSRVVALANGKGGVGKTTVASNLGGLAAADGMATLIIDVNGQGHVGRELGFRKGPLDDNGRAMRESVLSGAPLVPLKNVRPGLDVVVGGKEVSSIPSLLTLKFPDGPKNQALALAVSLQPIADAYDLIVIDSAPENPQLQQLALAAAKWLIVPVKSDAGSIEDGLGDISRQFALVKRFVNEPLDLLGVALFATGTQATAIRKDVHREVADVLGGVDGYMFDAFLRSSEAVARQSRKRGQLLHELELAANDSPKFWQVRSGQASSSDVVTRTSASVAEDMASLAKEIFTRIQQREAEAY